MNTSARRNMGIVWSDAVRNTSALPDAAGAGLPEHFTGMTYIGSGVLGSHGNLLIVCGNIQSLHAVRARPGWTICLSSETDQSGWYLRALIASENCDEHHQVTVYMDGQIVALLQGQSN